MLDCADAYPDINSRYRLYLVYALKTAFRLDGPDIETGRISGATIRKEFERVRSLPHKDLDLAAVFQRLEGHSTDAGTRAYWALTYATAVYMTLMAVEATQETGDFDRAHKRLIDLIDNLATNGTIVSVVDFNYDCVLEAVRWEYGSRPRFGWDVGRGRKVLADEDRPLSELAADGRFQQPVDETPYRFSVRLIKPHGDRCTFLRGSSDVFYSGGRHSHKDIASFPPRLSDISAGDKFVRSSIMPPTMSRLRHRSSFYEEEERRFKHVLSGCQAIVIVGWSARGSDSYYHQVFEDLRQRNGPPVVSYIVDKRDGGGSTAELEANLRVLFGNNVKISDLQVGGFHEAAIKRLGPKLGVTA